MKGAASKGKIVKGARTKAPPPEEDLYIFLDL